MQLGWNGNQLVVYNEGDTIQIGTFHRQCLALSPNESFIYTFQFSNQNWTIAIIFAPTNQTIGILEIEINPDYTLDWVIDGMAINVACQNVSIQAH